MKRFLQIGNCVALVFALVANYLVGAQVLAVPSINNISEKYATLLTPASYAFSIWSVIYVLLIVFVIYQARDLFRPSAKNTLPIAVGPYFIIASICNGLWTYLFVNEWISASVIVLFTLTVSLFIIMRRLKMALREEPFAIVLCVWWPLLLYTGWVTVACVVNIASWLQSIGVELNTFAASTILAVLGGLLVALLLERHVRELVLASAWGIFAVGVNLQSAQGDAIVSVAAFTVGALLVVIAGVHAFAHRKQNALKYVFPKL